MPSYAEVRMTFDPVPAVITMEQGDACNILPIEDPTQPGGWTCQCMERDCDGTCGLDRVDAYDSEGHLVESIFRCICGGG